MNPDIDQGIAPILLAPQTLLEPEKKEVVADAASGSAWVNRTLRQVIRTEVVGSTPGNIIHNVSVVEPFPPIIIGIIATSPPCGLGTS